MPYIETMEDEQAQGRARELFAADRERLGYVANYTRVFAHRPDVFAAWQELLAAVRASMSPRRYELATVAAARSLRSSYCTLAHGQVLASDHLDPVRVTSLVSDHRGAGLDEAEVAVMDLAAKVVDDATGVAQDDIDRLRGLGLDDLEVLDVVLAAAIRCFFSKTLDALGVEPDAAYADLEPGLRDALTVGRPIASE